MNENQDAIQDDAEFADTETDVTEVDEDDLDSVAGGADIPIANLPIY